MFDRRWHCADQVCASGEIGTILWCQAGCRVSPRRRRADSRGARPELVPSRRLSGCPNNYSMWFVSIVELSLVLFGISILAGVLGSLLGVGGGFVIVPVLTLVFHLDVRLAIGTSIVAVAATSCAGAARNVTESITNLRVATFLALATTLGAVTGALLVGVFDARFLFALFGVVLAASGVQMIRKHPTSAGKGASPAMETASVSTGAAVGGVRNRAIADRLALHSAYYDEAEGLDVPYVVVHTRLGLALMYLAGIFSGLLGIGSGVLKVPAMDLAMHIPMKVSTATSNLLIGLTAAASAVVYFARGDIDPLIAGPVAIGMLFGATQGSKLLRGMRSARLRVLFVIVLGVVAVQMIWKGIG